MELSEATSLSDTFITSLVFKVHSLPTNARSAWAARWWQNQESRIPLRPALDEKHRHLDHFASRRRSEKWRDRQVFFDISAVVHDDGRGRCPALAGRLCGIYETRPLTCRTVPMHHTRQPSVLRSYLDRFTSTPNYLCDTSSTAPMVLDGNNVLDPMIHVYRDQAIHVAKLDRPWKAHIIALMDNDQHAKAADIPTYDAVVNNSDDGYATLLPMVVAWRIAGINGILPTELVEAACRNQVRLIKAEITRCSAEKIPEDLLDSLAVYEFQLAQPRSD